MACGRCVCGCGTEAEGYLFSHDYKPGIVYYTLVPPKDTRKDEIAFGFMTDQANGTIIRIDSGIKDFIEAKLVSLNAALFDRIYASASCAFIMSRCPNVCPDVCANIGIFFALREY